MIQELEDVPWSIVDSLDDVWRCFDWLDVIETVIRLAWTPVSQKVSRNPLMRILLRFNAELIRYPRGDKFDIQDTGGDAVRLMRKAGVVCGCIGFDSHYTYWLIRRSQLTWAMHLIGGEPGAQLKYPASFWAEGQPYRKRQRPATRRRTGSVHRTGSVSDRRSLWERIKREIS